MGLRVGRRSAEDNNTTGKTLFEAMDPSRGGWLVLRAHRAPCPDFILFPVHLSRTGLLWIAVRPRTGISASLLSLYHRMCVHRAQKRAGAAATADFAEAKTRLKTLSPRGSCLFASVRRHPPHRYPPLSPSPLIGPGRTKMFPSDSKRVFLHGIILPFQLQRNFL